MREARVLLDSVQKVKQFSNICQKHVGDVIVYSGRYVVDGKSILGLMSLD